MLALLWFYSASVEGAFPHGIHIRNSTLRRGRGNATSALIVSGGPSREASSSAKPRAIHDVEITGNRIWGGVIIEGAEDVNLSWNEFMEKDSKPILRGNIELRMTGNRDARGQAIEE